LTHFDELPGVAHKDAHIILAVSPFCQCQVFASLAEVNTYKYNQHGMRHELCIHKTTNNNKHTSQLVVLLTLGTDTFLHSTVSNHQNHSKYLTCHPLLLHQLNLSWEYLEMQQLLHKDYLVVIRIQTAARSLL